MSAKRPYVCQLPFKDIKEKEVDKLYFSLFFYDKNDY